MLAVTDLTVIEGDARIPDTRVQEALGFADIQHLHKLIARNKKELELYGRIYGQSVRKLGPGRPVQTFLLTEEQASLICMFARTPKAVEARRLIIGVFTAWRKGQMPAAPLAGRDPFAACAGRARHVADHLLAVDGMVDAALNVTHLPIWQNGRRPSWWSNVDLRKFLTDAHRQMTLQDCRQRAAQRFGEDVPSISALQRYWARLDQVFGPSEKLPVALSDREAA